MSAAKFPRKIVRGWEAEARRTAVRNAPRRIECDIPQNDCPNDDCPDECLPYGKEPVELVITDAGVLLHVWSKGITLYLDDVELGALVAAVGLEAAR